MSSPIEIRPAGDARSRKRFLTLPYDLYRGDPNWIPRLRMDQRPMFAGQTAFFADAEMGLFLARRGDAVVGRIAAIHNRAHNAFHHDKTGFFGFFECARDDGEAADALFGAAEGWLAERGLHTLRGPVNPSMNSECGLLIQGFDDPPTVMMPYNPPYYAELFERNGFCKCKDLYAYSFTRSDVEPGSPTYERLRRIANTARAMNPRCEVHCLAGRSAGKEILRVMDAFEVARQQNWGYVPMSDAERREAVAALRGIVDPEIVVLAEVDGQTAGVLFAIPDVNQILAGSGGRLFPFTLFKFLRLRAYATRARIIAIAVLPQYRQTGVLALLFFEGLERSLRGRYQVAEASWVLEDNATSNHVIRRLLKVAPYKVYRIYEKSIQQGTSIAS